MPKLYRLAAVLLLLAGSATTAVQQPHITSAYTQFDWERCVIIRSGEEEARGRERPDDWRVGRCDGYRGTPIIWKTGDGRDDLDAGVENHAVYVRAHSFGPKVEWRLADGKPFAIIYRAKAVGYAAQGAPELLWSRLIVETIGTPDKPGCPVAKFNALKPNANILARRAADAVLSGKARCIELNE